MVREAMLLEHQGRLPEAITGYQRVLERWPQLPDCWYRLGLLQRKARRFSAARESYQQAIDRDVKRPEEVYLNRSVLPRRRRAAPSRLRACGRSESRFIRVLRVAPGITRSNTMR